MKIIKKILKYMLLVIVILIVITIFPVISYKKEINKSPLPPEYKKGVYHMHSIFSDGMGTIDDITKAAASMDLDFVIITDHGRPNRKASGATSYSNGILLIGGSEFSLHSGHLACLGYKLPDYIFPPEPQEAIDEINTDNAVSFISHPFDGKIPWTDWNVHGFTGIEVLSCYSSARKISYFKLAQFPLQYLLNSNYALTSTLEYPQENIKKWNALNREKGTGVYGIYALDAHAKLPITEKRHLNFPSYESMFEILRVYVNIDTPLDADANRAAGTIISSLRNGNFFNVIEAIAPANGFRAYFVDKSGRRVEMGSGSTGTEGKLNIHLPFNFETDIIVRRDGDTFEHVTNNREKELEIDVKGPGFYVIEVYVSDHKFDTLPWILTNPFFVGSRDTGASASSTPAGETKEVDVRRLLGCEKGFFIVEKNPGSVGELGYGETGGGELVTSLRFKLSRDSRSGRDFWSALAVRKRLDFSGSEGICFRARSDRKRRFWVEFRTGEQGNEVWYRHSFLAEEEWKRFVVPFEKFHVIFGEKKVPDLSGISSFFFSINNAGAYEGASGVMDLKDIGLYR